MRHLEILYSYTIKRVNLNFTELASHLYNSEGNYFNFVILLLLGKDAIYTIPVKNILAVEKLEESSFNKKNVSYRYKAF